MHIIDLRCVKVGKCNDRDFKYVLQNWRFRFFFFFWYVARHTLVFLYWCFRNSPVKMRPIRCSENLGRDYQSTPCIVPNSEDSDRNSGEALRPPSYENGKECSAGSYRGADKSLARPNWRKNWKVAIFRPTRWLLMPRRHGCTDKLLNFFFWVSCKS